ncbi:hypothetical protein PFISCL1PPCAC_25197, partial [Pristionchus fissidentatus]
RRKKRRRGSADERSREKDDQSIALVVDQPNTRRERGVNGTTVMSTESDWKVARRGGTGAWVKWPSEGEKRPIDKLVIQL